jgi:hypothetical protein
MKTFEKDGKINFVDDNNVLVGFDYEGCCCEVFGYFFSKAVPQAIDFEGDQSSNTEGFNFDKDFFHEGDEFVTFKLVKGSEEIFLTIYNSHNGYYSHGFDMEVGGIKVRDGSL